MARGSTDRKTSSLLNLLSLISICILIVIFTLRIIYHFVPDFTFIGKINHILDIIQNALMAIVVFFGGLNYALSIRDSGWRVFMVILCILFAVLFVLGYIWL